MAPVPILPDRLDWPSAIGNFLLNFGALEYFVFVFLNDRLSPEEFVRMRELHLKARLDRIAKYLSENGYPQAEQKAFANLTASLDPIRELRNHIAHGHMYCRIDRNTGKPVVTVLKAKDLDMEHAPKTKHLEFSELQNALTTLTKLIEEFQRLAGFVSEQTVAS
jgi:hypothetical protein